MSTEPIQLQYGHHPKRWPIYLRRIAALLLVGSNVYFAIDLWGMDAWLWGKMLWAQHRCLTYAQPPERVVWEQGAAPGPVAVPSGYVKTIHENYWESRWQVANVELAGFEDICTAVSTKCLAVTGSVVLFFIRIRVGRDMHPLPARDAVRPYAGALGHYPLAATDRWRSEDDTDVAGDEARDVSFSTSRAARGISRSRRRHLRRPLQDLSRAD